jgi:hypothetical protein
MQKQLSSLSDFFDAVGSDMAVFIGVDPGHEGAIAFLSADGHHVFFLDVPTVSLAAKRKSGTRTEFDFNGFLQALSPVVTSKCAVTLVVERGQPMGRDSGVTGFSVGVYWGAFRMWSASIWNRLSRTMYPSPSVWKKKAGLIKKQKADSIQAAIRRVPVSSAWLTRVKDHNRAEALILADMARRGELEN